MNHNLVGACVVSRSPRSSKDNPKRDWYVWSDTPAEVRGSTHHLHRYRELELDPTTRRPVSTTGIAFFSHQPDLNYDNPEVSGGDASRSCGFWLDLGLDGARLDAVPYLFEREGTKLREPAPRRTTTSKRVRHEIEDQTIPTRVLLAEGQSVARRCRAVLRGTTATSARLCFHFPVMPRMFHGAAA